MTKKETPLAGAVGADQQGATNIKVQNLSQQNTPSSSTGQVQALPGNTATTQKICAWDHSPSEKPHRVARYLLQPSKQMRLF